MNNRAHGAFRARSAASALAYLLLGPLSQPPAAAGCKTPELVLQYLHADRVYDISFAAHAPLMATAGGDGWVDLWSTRDWTKKRSLKVEESGTVWFGQGMALSPNGQILARCAPQAGVELWSTSSGSLVGILGAGEGRVVAVIWSPDGRFIAAAGRSITLWDAAGGKLVGRIPGAYASLSFSGNGRLLGAADDSSRADVFDVQTGRKLRSLQDKSGAWMPIALSRDGRLAATAGEDPGWDPGPLPRDEQGNEYAPSEAFYAHQFKIKVWDVRTGKRLRILPGQWSTNSLNQTLRFTPDGLRLFVGGEGEAVIWDLKTGRRLTTLKDSYASQISPDGRTAVVSWNGLSICRAPDGRKITRLHPPPLPIKALAFSADGTRLAVGEEGLCTIVRVWDILAGRQMLALQGPPPNLRNVMFLPGGQVVGNSYNGIYVWDTVSGAVVRKGEGPVVRDEGGAYHEWAFLTPDGRRMISGLQAFARGGLTVWDWATRRRERTFSLSPGVLSTCAVSPDGRYLAAASGLQKASVQVMDLASGRKISELQVADKYVANLVFSPDTETIAGYNAYGRVSHWDRTTGCLKRYIDIGDVRSGELAMAFVPHSVLFAVANGGTVRFFDTARGVAAGTIAVTESAVSALAFSPDGSTMAVGRQDGFVELWSLNPDRLLLTMVGFTALDRTRVSAAWAAWTPDGLYDWSVDAEKLIRWRLDGKLYPASSLPGLVCRSSPLRSQRG